MGRKRRLHYKDLDAMRFLAFLPVFMFCALFLMSTDENPFVSDMAAVIGYVKQNSIDFFFFLSSFLLTAHALREVKYNKTFGFKSFYIRRLMRIMPLFVLAIIFAFILHPYIVKMLAFEPIQTPNFLKFFTSPPTFPSTLSKEQFVYLSVIWSIYLFLQFYLFWGIILKFFLQHIKYVSFGLIALGIGSRIFHVLTDTPIEFDVLTAGISIGIGALTANTVRNDERSIELIKHLTKGNHVIVYLLGVALLISGYTYLGGTYGGIIVPLLSCSFYAYVIMEQTFSKNSIYKLHKNKLLSRLGRISYGLLIYSSIVLVICIIALDSLNLDLGAIPIQFGFVTFSFFISWIVADVSYNIFERPIYAIKKEFKHS